MHRALLLVVMMTACTSDTELAREAYVRGAFCPPERVRAVAHPELAMFYDDAHPSTPWEEPVPPTEVAIDPARLALWQRKRDADRAAWEARQARVVAPTRRGSTVQELDGCDGVQLWACGYGRTHCSRIEDANRDLVLACSDGRAARYANGAFSCAPQPPFSRTGCVARCPAGEYRCVLGCADSALDECRRGGFEALGMCAGLAKDRDGLAGTVAQVASASAAAAMGEQLRRCTTGCGSSARCSGDCFGQAADRCDAEHVGDAICTQLRKAAETYQRKVELERR